MPFSLAQQPPFHYPPHFARLRVLHHHTTPRPPSSPCVSAAPPKLSTASPLRRTRTFFFSCPLFLVPKSANTTTLLLCHPLLLHGPTDELPCGSRWLSRHQSVACHSGDDRPVQRDTASSYKPPQLHATEPQNLHRLPPSTLSATAFPSFSVTTAVELSILSRSGGHQHRHISPRGRRSSRPASWRQWLRYQAQPPP